MHPAVYWIWLQQALGVGAPQAEELLREHGSAKQIFEAKNIAPTGLQPEQFRRLADKDLSEAKATLKEIEDGQYFVMTPEDEAYAALFEGMYAPPVVLYGKGTCVNVVSRPTVAIVGTRHHDEAGVLVTRCLAAGLAAGGAVVVSGGAVGLDSEALTAALDEGGVCISFAACGIDVDYPKATAAVRERIVENGGMILSEFPLGSTAHRHHFRIRNRLISAASCGTLVTQAPRKSGALITAAWAREQGREVYAAPGTIGTPYSEGSNELLKDGAKIVTHAVDILMDHIERYPFAVNIEASVVAEERAAKQYREERYKRHVPREAVPSSPMMQVAQPPVKAETAHVIPCPANVSGDAKRVYEALKERPQTVSELARTLGVSPATVMANMTMLELHGVITCEAGQQYALKTQT